HAKEQGLPLNPTKLNGMCGKLKCCLVYENEQYVELKAQLPRPGAEVELPQGVGVVRDIDVPRERVVVQLHDSGAVVAVPAAELQLAEPVRDDGGPRRRRRRSASLRRRFCAATGTRPRPRA